MKIDYWYKMLPVIGVITLILGLTVDTKGISNTFVQLVSIGVICIGIGEWINHPLQTKVGHGFKIESYARLNKISGNGWDLLGVAFIVYAIIFHR